MTLKGHALRSISDFRCFGLGMLNQCAANTVFQNLKKNLQSETLQVPSISSKGYSICVSVGQIRKLRHREV